MTYNTSIIQTLKNRANGVKITNSSHGTIGSDVSVLLDFLSDSCWISDTVLESYFTLDFGERTVCVERYAFKIYGFDHYPISWSVYGSYDGLNWSLIDHKDDNICLEFNKFRDDNIRICGKHYVKMFEADSPMCSRFIKVQQNGQNSGKYDSTAANSEWINAFYLSGFEAFGRIYVPFGVQSNKCSSFIPHITLSIIFVLTC